MRGPTARLLVMVLAALIAGCATPKGDLFTTAFPFIDGSLDGSIDIAALPVTLEDVTGTVTGIGASELRQDERQLDIVGGVARADPADPNAVRVLWLGGACEALVRMVLHVDDGRLALEIEPQHSFSVVPVGCPALGVARAIVISFSAPADPQRLFVRNHLD